MIVLDTNVVSELMRPAPHPAVVTWMLDHQTDRLHTTAVTYAEILYGIERLPRGRRRTHLRSTAFDVFDAFAEQVLPFDADAAIEYARIVEAGERRGRPINGFDAQIAAICRAHAASLATRNVKDFDGTGVTIVDPWT